MSVRHTGNLKFKAMNRMFFITAVVIATISLKANAQTVAQANLSIEGQPLIVSSVSDSTVKSVTKDTTVVRIGKKDVMVIKHEGGTEFSSRKADGHPKKNRKFDGHWEGIEIGFNGFANSDYSMYNQTEFMSLTQEKSLELNFNFYELNIGLVKRYVGLVSGMGIRFNSYRFEKPYTLQPGENRTEAVPLTYNNLSKSKLATTYLTVPILLEFQIPVANDRRPLFINAGVVGSAKIGSHTKVKHGGEKDKYRNGFDINPFKYEATARIGFKEVGLFGSYSLNDLFKSGKGPVLTPFTIGICFTDLD